MRSQGRSYVQWTSVDERARFVTYVQTALGQWIYSVGPDGHQRTYPELAEATGISMDQISKWLRGSQVPSGSVHGEALRSGRLRAEPGEHARDEALDELRAGRRSARSEAEKRSRRSQGRAARPEAKPEKVSEPEFQVAELDIHDAISRMDIPVKTKLQLSALIALAESGAVFDIEVKVRAR